mmetsp:Transcript_8707/g.20159  ORF Transcript_8707/g.20159 Transcript_8707/m.20159 type:complete len:328 (-) Transcript_8707:6-989(-)
MELGLGLSLHGFRCAIIECGRQRSWERAVGLLTKLERRGLQANEKVYADVITACGKADQWQEAIQLLETMREKQIDPTDESYNAAMTELAICGRWSEAFQLFEDMEERELCPDATAYASVIRACASQSDWAGGLRVFAEMQGRAITANVQSFFALSQLCFKSPGLWQQAVWVIEEMRSLSTPAADDAETWPHVYSTCASTCVRAQEWEQASCILADFQRLSLPVPFILNLAQIQTMVARHQCAPWQAALLWLAQRGEPDEDAVAAAIRSCGPGWQHALELVLDLQEEGFTMSARIYQELVSASMSFDEDQEDITQVAESLQFDEQAE